MNMENDRMKHLVGIVTEALSAAAFLGLLCLVVLMIYMLG